MLELTNTSESLTHLDQSKIGISSMNINFILSTQTQIYMRNLKDTCAVRTVISFIAYWNCCFIFYRSLSPNFMQCELQSIKIAVLATDFFYSCPPFKLFICLNFYWNHDHLIEIRIQNFVYENFRIKFDLISILNKKK